MPIPMIIDTDTASDDAVALVMALRHHDYDVVAITTVAGNCSVEQATQNALYTAELCGSDVPIHVGCNSPLVVEPQFATWFHGEDGLGDQGYPPPMRGATSTDGVGALIEAVRAHPGCILVTLGPLTNVALAVRQAPDIVAMFDRCVVMGGTTNTVGNVTPAAEFNLWFDPHAAAAVFASGLPIELGAWELCRGEAGLDESDQGQLRALDTELGHFFLDCNSTALAAAKAQSGSDRLELPDPVTMAIALEKDNVVIKSSRHNVEIEAESNLTRGMSVVDSLDVTGKPANAEVFWEIDTARFKRMVIDAARP